MGNTISPESRDSMRNLASKIFAIDCEVLNVGTRQGATGYIDFIGQHEVTGSIAKGVDEVGRNFIVWKAECELISNGETKNYSTFTTFFKRYADDPDSVLYHTCGHSGQNLFTTEGGCSQGQMKFLLELLETRKVTLNKEQMEDNRIIFKYYPFNLSDDATLKINIPSN